MLMDCAGYKTLRDISVIEKNGRSGGIRTPDPQAPSLIRYQTALRSVIPFIADTALLVQAQDRKKDVGDGKKQPGAC